MQSATVEEEKKKKAWYLKLLADLKAILVREEQAMIQFKHELGRRILQERENGNIQYGDILDFMKQLAEDLNYSWRELYYCVEFAQKYPNLEDFLKDSRKVLTPVSKEPTWKEIRNIVLSKGIEQLKEEPEAKELKECELEEFLMSVYRVVNERKDQMLNCNECEIREKCTIFKTKLLMFGEQYFSD